MVDPIIRAEGLVLRYGTRTILEETSFEVERGEIFVIAGGSGSGKTMLLKNMIGLLTPDAGRVLVDGIDVSRARGDERTQFLRSIGVAFQGNALFGALTLLENVRLPLEELTTLPPDVQETIALTKLRLVSLDDAASCLPSEASGGMRKRAGIARALALGPKVMFLDEPSAGLDPITSASLDQLILDLRRLLGVTFVIVSHELPSIFEIADRVLILEAAKRRAVALDTPARLRDQTENRYVHEFFNRRARPRVAVREAA